MSSKTRHDQLIAAGWRYDNTQNRYTPPGEVQKGTEKWFNEAAAFAVLQSSQRSPSKHQGRAAPIRDPRRQEPQ